MDQDKPEEKIYGENRAGPDDRPSRGVCSETCRFFLGESRSHIGMALCSNPDYIKFREECRSSIGVECDFWTFDEGDPIDPRTISFEYGGLENRGRGRDLVYNAMLFRMKAGSRIIEYPGVILDISLDGIGFILPVTLDSIPKEFCLIKKFAAGDPIKLSCLGRRIKTHSSVTEIGASFVERISEEMLHSLSRTG